MFYHRKENSLKRVRLENISAKITIPPSPVKYATVTTVDIIGLNYDCNISSS